MSNVLPPAGTHRLLDLLAPYVPDAFIDDLCPRRFTGGRRCALNAPQLWRVHLLALLTSTHSVNLVVAQLPEQAAWRRFCRLRRHWPGVRMLQEFRQQIGVGGLRRINQHLLERLLRPRRATARRRVNGCNGFAGRLRWLQKKAPALTPPPTPLWADAHSRPGRAAGLWATKNTPCACGCRRLTPRSPCCRWSVGWPRPM